MSRLLQLGADPSKLYAQFRQREEERSDSQEDVRLQAQNRLTEQIDGRENVSVRDYRRAREAGDYLIVEPDLNLGDMSYHDYRRVREADQLGREAISYADYGSSMRATEPEPVSEPQTDSTECDLEVYRAEREEELNG